MDCLLTDSPKRSDGHTLSHLDKFTDVDIRNMYVRPLARGERSPAVDCGFILTSIKWLSDSDTLKVVNASETYKQLIVRALRDAGQLN